MMPNFNIIKPSVERIDEKDNLKRIELAGRVCYKSEKKITEGSARAFCERIIESDHTSVLEHSNVLVVVPGHIGDDIAAYARRYHTLTGKQPMLTITSYILGYLLISGNVRAWRDVLLTQDRYTFAGDPLLDVCEDADYDLSEHRMDPMYLDPNLREIHSRITLRITCDRGVSHELVRHRVMSFSQESTRYVNYGKRGYTFIEPWWWDTMRGVMKHLILSEMKHSISVYDAMISEGATPQLARAVLPNQIKTEVVVTATPAQWTEFLWLRMHKAAHPDMQRVARLVRDALGDDVRIPEKED
jgi:thymidylate synthase (FAD)